MRYKLGDKYNAEYIAPAELGAGFDCFLSGDVIYADDNVFIVKASLGSNAEIVQWRSLSFAKCKQHYPALDFDFVPNLPPIFDYFVPLIQGTEEFLIDEGEFI